MEQISEEDFEKVDNLPKKKKKKKMEVIMITESHFKTLLAKMENPVLAQQELAVQIKSFLDQKIKVEMEDKGTLSDSTRRWVDTYNNILEKIQKAVYGDKSVNLHIHKVSHSDIAAKIRQSESGK
ncbi:hypothetical protein LCGC14_1151180 [marine sediment metagenome]|uniref:Uncharacterized protein n=1 Tax=marine sediment metagenome TaxID=412755 RepID=A0A0F9LVD8_9ZZZZ